MADEDTLTDEGTRGGTRERIELPEDMAFGKSNRSFPKPKRTGRAREDAFYDIVAKVEIAAQDPEETYEIGGLTDTKQVEKTARYVREAAKHLTKQAREDDPNAPEVRVKVSPLPDEDCVLFLVREPVAPSENGEADGDVDLILDDEEDDELDDDDEDWED